jgi:hypothetical protein
MKPELSYLPPLKVHGLFLWFGATISIIMVLQVTMMSTFITAYKTVSTDMARVYLPSASEAIDDLNPDKQRLMVNIVHEVPGDKACPQLKYKQGVLIQPCQIPEHWKIIIKRQEVPKEELLKAIQIEGDIDRPGGAGSKTLSNRPVMIRADSSAPGWALMRVLEACGRALVWKIEIGAVKPAE